MSSEVGVKLSIPVASVLPLSYKETNVASGVSDTTDSRSCVM